MAFKIIIRGFFLSSMLATPDVYTPIYLLHENNIKVIKNKYNLIFFIISDLIIVLLIHFQ